MTALPGPGFRAFPGYRTGARCQLCPFFGKGLWNAAFAVSLKAAQRYVEYRWAGVLNRFRSGAVPYLRWPFAVTA